MQPILITRYVEHEGPGYFADFIERRGISHQLVKVDRNEPLPSSIDRFSGLVLMGGPMSVNDDLPWIAPVLSLIRQAVDADLPVLGHCLGAQLISKALGGAVMPNPVPEYGWLPVVSAGNSSALDWLDGLPREIEVLHWHGETFTLPPGATRIQRSRDCVNQAFVFGKTLALQYHVEMTADMVRKWVTLGADDLAHPARTVQSPEQILDDLAGRVSRLQGIADILYSHWLQGLD